MKVDCKIFLIKDSWGNKVSVVCETPNDTVQVSGLSNKEGKSICFESEAYHLDIWANACGLEIKQIERSFAFDELWNAEK